MRSLTIGVWVVAIAVSIYATQLAQALLVPLVLGILLSYVLEPPVKTLVKQGLPRTLAATGVFAALLVTISAVAYSLANQTTTLIGKLPTAAQELRAVIEAHKSNVNPVTQVQRAADELQRLASAA